MKTIKLFLGIVGLFLIIACSSDSGDRSNQMRVFAKGTFIDNSTSKLGGEGQFPSNVIIITSFRINIEELTLKYLYPNEDDNGGGEAGRNDGPEYKKVTVTGPWELDLLNQTISITTVDVPNGIYKAAKLELGKSLVPTSPIVNKTVEVTGTIDGIPFIFWHDFYQRLELNHRNLNGRLVINNNSLDMLFDFNLNDLTDLIDISSAVDRDGDGVIEIGPNDDDGNSELALLLNQHLGQCSGIGENDN